MQDNISFFELDNKGVVHYIHSQAHCLEMVYEDTEDDKLYRLEMGKDFVIVAASEIETPAPPSELDFKKWHKPSMDAQCAFIFTGCVGTEVGDYRFKIESGRLVLVQPVTINDSFALHSLNCLRDVCVDHHVQKGNLLYAVGYHRETLKQIFVEVHIGTDRALQMYTLESDEGKIFILTLSIDPWDGRIYLGGELRIQTTEEDEPFQSRPYLQTLLYQS